MHELPIRALCPVCWQAVSRTVGGRRVVFHFDTAHNVCPMTRRAFQDCYPLDVDPKLRGAA